MSNESNDLLEILLRDCAAAAPQPWYPSAYVNQTGISRARIDTDLDRLRMGGLISLTEWVQGKGQGYTVTPEGSKVLADPRKMQQLREKGIVAKPVPAPLRAPDIRNTTYGRGEAVREAFLNPVRPRITFLLLALNILVFVVGMVMAQRDQVLGPYLSMANSNAGNIHNLLGALNRPAVVIQNQWWRLLAHFFVHYGLLHIGMNMYFLYSLGPMVESMWGSTRYLVLYLVSGLGGGCASLIFSSPITAVAGASGALCGILTSMLVWVFLNKAYLPQSIFSRLSRGIITNILLIAFISILPGVSGSAHFGGALAGAVIACPLVYHRFGLPWQRWLALSGALAVPIVCLTTVFFSITLAEFLAPVEQATIPPYNQYCVPFLKNENPEQLFKDTSAIAKAHQVFSVSLEKLHWAKIKLYFLGNTWADKETTKLAKEYLAAWSDFFTEFNKILERGTPWSNQEYRDLILKQRVAIRLRGNLNP